jgi:hypothetical protein
MSCWFLACLTLQPWRWRQYTFLQSVGGLLPDCMMLIPEESISHYYGCENHTNPALLKLITPNNFIFDDNGCFFTSPKFCVSQWYSTVTKRGKSRVAQLLKEEIKCRWTFGTTYVIGLYCMSLMTMRTHPSEMSASLYQWMSGCSIMTVCSSSHHTCYVMHYLAGSDCLYIFPSSVK